MADLGTRADRLLGCVGTVRYHGQRLGPGLFLCGVTTLAASYLADRYGFSQILGALLLGMSISNVSKQGEFSAGIEFCARQVLRFGVALLGARIGFEQVYALGLTPLLVVLCAVIGTLLFSLAMARMLGIDALKGLVSGAAVAICGVSAALAVTAVLQGKGKFNDSSSERHLLCTLIVVTGFSTLAMLTYPGLLVMLGFSPEQIGMFLGASIHDVAQVFGAGHLVSDYVAELATYTKMLRVAMLVPLIMIVICVVPPAERGSAQRFASFPLFLVGFALLMVLANVNLLPQAATVAASDLSKLCLLLAMSALGIKTNILDVFSSGLKLFILLALNTTFIAGIVLLMIF